MSSWTDSPVGPKNIEFWKTKFFGVYSHFFFISVGDLRQIENNIKQILPEYHGEVFAHSLRFGQE